jgi:hypothetical protein
VTQAAKSTVSASSSAPIIDDADIANLSGTPLGTTGDDGHIWSDRPNQGQTFTTGSVPEGYVLSSVTLLNMSSTEAAAGPFTIRIGTVSGNTFTELLKTVTSTTAAFGPNQYITVQLPQSLHLDPDTLYGFDWASAGRGFVSAYTAGNSNYLGGEAYSTGDNQIPDDNNLLSRGFDRTFHLNITALPTPAALPAGLVIIGFIAARRRR